MGREVPINCPSFGNSIAVSDGFEFGSRLDVGTSVGGGSSDEWMRFDEDEDEDGRLRTDGRRVCDVDGRVGEVECDEDEED